jgi:predicted O-methyltransferase YrrM
MPRAIHYEESLSYIGTLYPADESAKSQYLSATELAEYGEVIDSGVARMMQVVLRLLRPRKILEIGTSIGYSTMTMARIAQQYGGAITTIEYDEASARQARKNFENAGVSDLIEIKIGDARAIVPALSADYDLIFQDVGDKTLYAELLDDVVSRLKPGGVLLAEDTLMGAMNMSLSHLISHNFEPKFFQELKTGVISLETFNTLVANHPALCSTLLPIGDGLTIAIKTS